MNEPRWLPLEVVLAVHDELLRRFGGLSGVKDAGMLDSALGKPRNLFAYGEPSLFELATAYAAGIVRNHPFNDGNKRTGFMAAYTFLEANGCAFVAEEADVIVMTRALAAGEVDEAGYARWLADSCR